MPIARSNTTLPSDETVTSLFEVAYHASFLTEESRRLAFRIIFLPQKELQGLLERVQEEPRRYSSVVFDLARPFSVGEVLRLAPATDLTKMMICVEEHPDISGELRIWGLLDVGASWWKFVTGESSGGMPPPDGLTISSVEPGNLTVSRQGWILFSLRQGEIVSPAGYALYTGPLADFLNPAKQALQRAVLRDLGREKWSTGLYNDEEYPQRTYIRQLERLLFYIRQRFHGGTVLIVPDALAVEDSRITDRLSIKYAAAHGHIWQLLIGTLVAHDRFYKLHFPLWDTADTVTAQDYRDVSIAESRKDSLEQALLDSIQSVAALSGVDGAIVLTDRLRLLGFGAEVIASSPTLKTVQIARDGSSAAATPRSIESYGTRHRSAFRFCSSYEDAVALVVSQDGGVKAVKRVGPNVMMWPDINFGTLGL